MADDNYKLSGLEFDIKSNDKQAQDSLDLIVKKLNTLKDATKNTSFTRITNQLTKLANSFGEITKSLNGINKLDSVTENLIKLNEIKISSSIAKQITSIGQAAASIKTEDVVNIKMLGEALKTIDGVKANIKIGNNTAKVAKETTDAVKAVQAKAGFTEKSLPVKDGSKAEKVDFGSTAELTQKANDFIKAADAVELMRLKLVNLKRELGVELSKNTDGYSDRVISLTERIQGLEQEIAEATNRTSRSAEIFAEMKSVLGGVIPFLKKLGSMFKPVGSAAVSATKKLLQFISKVTLVKSVGSKLASSVQTFTSKIGTFFASIKRIAFYRLLRTIIKSITSGFKEGMENLYQYSLIMGTEFAPNMDRIATSLLYLKNSLGALTDPIVARLAPALDLLVDKFVDLLNIVNQVLSVLNGESTYTAAKKYATTWAEAADDTKAAIDEIKRYVLGFDELNILGKKNNGKGSADSNALDYSQMFEERAVSTAVSTFVDKIKTAFKQKDFINLGRMIGTWINKGISQIPDYAIGIKIGTTVNEITEMLYGLFDTVNSTALGTKIGNNIAKAVKTIKWDRIGITAGTFVNRIIDFYDGIISTVSLGDIGAGLGTMFANAVGKIDWSKAAHSVGETFNQIGTFFSELITKAKLGNFGEDIATFINKAVKTVDWAEKGRNLATTFNGIIAFFKNLILKTDFKKIGGSLGTFFTNAVKNTNWTDLGITAAKTLTGVLDFFTSFISHTDFKEVGKAVGSAIKSFLKTLNDWFKKQDFVQLGKDILNGIVQFVDGLDVGNIIYQLGLALWNLLKAAVEIAFGIGLDIGEKIVQWGKDIGSWFSEGWDEVVGDLFDFGDKTTMSESGKAFAKGFVGILQATPLWAYLEEQYGAKAAMQSVAQEAASASASQLGYASHNVLFNTLTQGGTKALPDNVTISDLNYIYGLISSASETALGTNAKVVSQAFSQLVPAAIGAYYPNLALDNYPETRKAFETVLNSTIERLLYSSSGTSHSHTKGVIDGELGSSIGNAINLTGTVSTLSLTDAAKVGLVKAVADIATKNSVSLKVESAAKTALKSAVAGIGLSGVMSTINPAAAKTGLQNTVKGYYLNGTVTHFSPTGRAWDDYHREVIDYGLTGTITQITIANAAKAAAANAIAVAVSIGGMATGGIINHGHAIPMYAGGTTKAHGSMFIAGENGAEVVGNINGRTEILNRSQMAQAMYAAAVNGMSSMATAIDNTFIQGANAIINALDNDDSNNMTALVDGVREGVYEATAAQNELLKQQNEILLDILAKDNTTEITTNSVVKALARKNRRDGKYTVPVGVT